MKLYNCAWAVLLTLALIMCCVGPAYVRVLSARAVRTSESMEPALARPEQDQAAQRKLASARRGVNQADVVR